MLMWPIRNWDKLLQNTAFPLEQKHLGLVQPSHLRKASAAEFSGKQSKGKTNSRKCRGNTLLLSMPALPSKHLTLPRVSAKKHPTVGWIYINKQLLCSKLPLALHPPGRQQTLGVKSSFLLVAEDLLVAHSLSAHRPAFQTFTSTQRNYSLKSLFSTQYVFAWTWLQGCVCDPENHSSPHPQALLSCSWPCFSLAEKDGTWFQN